MGNKYYTPSIEEFHVGFEYEILETNDALIKIGEKREYVWFKRIANEHIFEEEINTMDGEMPFSAGFSEGTIRVKYLDKEDIESLGFIESKETDGYFYKELNRNSEKLVLELIQYKATGSFTPDADISSLKFFSMIKIQNTGGAPAYVLGEWITSKGVLYYGECKNKSELKRILKMIGYENS